ncbi:MAG: hypothetical protein HWN67_17430 [Candidatus Helarchaeota archaeon]|nr:hypothetical protein [Candidatus Helarchaeota archaeon]
MPYNYADIPEDVNTKQYLPLFHNLWMGYQQLGWEYFQRAFQIVIKDIYNISLIRLNNSIQTANKVLKGEIKNPEKVLAFAFFPPVIQIRQDLQIGTTKLLFGDSVDTSFLVVDDETREILFIVNNHMEDGIPVDWWYVGSEDEVLDRRHMKLGIKLRDFPQKLKIKSFMEIGLRSIDILQDIRNERTPQWQHSKYFTSVTWVSAIIDQIEYLSNYDALSALWDGLEAKNFGLPDNLFAYCPWPSMIKNFVLMGRSRWTLLLAGLTTQHKLYAQGSNKKNWDWHEEHFPEFVELFFRQGWEEKGLNLPSESISKTYPYLNEKNDVPKKFTLTSKKQKRIFCEDLGLDWKEASRGVYLDVTHETPETENIDQNKIISTGIGTETKIRNEIS